MASNAFWCRGGSGGASVSAAPGPSVADPSGHAVGGGDLEQFVQQAADLRFLGAALEQGHRLALDEGHGGGNGLHLEGLGQLREHLDVGGAEDQPAVIAVHDPFEDVDQFGGAGRVGRPERDDDRDLGRQLHEFLEIGFGDVHPQRTAGVLRVRRCRGGRPGRPGCAGGAWRGRRRGGSLFQGGEVDGAPQVERVGGSRRDRAGSWRSHGSTLATSAPAGATRKDPGSRKDPAWWPGLFCRHRFCRCWSVTVRWPAYLKLAPTRPRVAATSFIGSWDPAGGM